MWILKRLKGGILSMDPEGGMMKERRKVEKGGMPSVKKSVSGSVQILISPSEGGE